ncbi:hypothetical protein MJO28_012121 [Puccinia striiformis f. sp. tritici]|uniref:Uncharacterized protein n=1 Tax=Puccinia striiformis f. sp. tritici TaxID=168172 RepID=A0ACC0E0K8_9BASI|nr:hypothetical protein Pst134EB_023848 [Puccinia striiformis f. sp. tritici]KAI7942094.1 hypothetical protein MJO28_012121 [Puccinia striiformis f. sp. tritici]KAI7945922.1 hypothetical protein MJO29_012310 [Puccinia striiformis f. sp. tritici]KAI9611241.1 hypothetical protein KEM48_004624 [Puccinia striiformis f. sp. tritici PST-130]
MSSHVGEVSVTPPSVQHRIGAQIPVFENSVDVVSDGSEGGLRQTNSNPTDLDTGTEEESENATGPNRTEEGQVNNPSPPMSPEERENRERLRGFIMEANSHGDHRAVLMFMRILCPSINSQIPEEPEFDSDGRRRTRRIYSPTSPRGYMIYESGHYFVPGLVPPDSPATLPYHHHHNLPRIDRSKKIRKQKKKARKQGAYNRQLI